MHSASKQQQLRRQQQQQQPVDQQRRSPLRSNSSQTRATSQAVAVPLTSAGQIDSKKSELETKTNIAQEQQQQQQ